MNFSAPKLRALSKIWVRLYRGMRRGSICARSSRLGELTALPAYLHISSYAMLAMLSFINRGDACKCRTYPRRGLHTCVATGQQLEFDHQHF